jgi:hypothetical protein
MIKITATIIKNNKNYRTRIFLDTFKLLKITILHKRWCLQTVESSIPLQRQ